MRTKFNDLVLVLMLVIPFSSYAETLSDPFLGDYEGVTLNRGQYPLSRPGSRLVAQVYPVGNDVYVVKFMNDLYRRAEVFARGRGTGDGNKVIFNSGTVRGGISNDSMVGEIYNKGDWIGFEMKKAEPSSSTEGVKPTREGIVLFDGSDFDEWTSRADIPIQWKIVNGNEMEVVPRQAPNEPNTDILTKREFTDVFLHMEFKLSLMPDLAGQHRCNSGLTFRGITEVQILDSYGLEGWWNECGSLYHNSPPKVNACYPPLRWQTYDVILYGPKFDENGKRIKDAVLTVFHNGKRIHYQYPVKRGPDQLEDGQTEFPFSIQLQDHRNVLWFRNIWAIDLSENPEFPAYMNELGE